MREEDNIVEWEQLSPQAQQLIRAYEESDAEGSYIGLELLKDQLLEVGYFMDYYLDAEISVLRELTPQEKKLKEENYFKFIEELNKEEDE